MQNWRCHWWERCPIKSQYQNRLDLHPCSGLHEIPVLHYSIIFVCVFVIPSNSAPFIVQLLYFPRSSLIYCTFIPKLKYVYYFYFQHSWHNDPLFLYPVNRLILYPVNRFSPPTFLLLCVSHCISWFARVVFFYQNLVCPIICKESKKCKKDFEISLPGDLSPFSFSLTIASSTKNVVWQGGTN